MPTTAHFTRLGGAVSHAPCVICIGNFDGVHRGHQRVLGDARTRAIAAGIPIVVLTFDPHPAVALGRKPPPMLTALERKAELLVGLGVDEVFVKTFDADFAAFSPERFVSELLVAQLGAKLVVVGQNFRFGRARAGDFGALEKLGASHGFDVVPFELCGDARGAFSSTRVRDAIVRGDMTDATEVLGRMHAFSGVVGRGAQRGRTIGFPTANVEDVIEVVPARGVYAVFVDALGESGASELGRGVMNIGVRPTVDDAERVSREVHIFDFDRDIYGARVRVHVGARIRDEKKFGSIDELRAQIALDAARAKDLTATGRLR